MGHLHDRPGMARNVLSMIRVLLALALEDGIREDNPAIGIKRPKLSKDGWHCWTEDEIATFEAKHPVGSQARVCPRSCPLHRATSFLLEVSAP